MKSYPEIVVAPEDRRDALRLPASNAPEVAVDESGNQNHSAEVLDVSRTGIRLRTFHPFRCGSVVTLSAPVGTELPTCRAEVMREEVVENGGPAWFDYGLRFIDCDADERHTWFLSLRRRDAA